MPLSLLVAIFLAFGFVSPTFPRPMTGQDIQDREVLVLAAVALVFGVALVWGERIAWSVARRGGATTRLRRLHLRASRVVAGLILILYATLLYGLDWPAVVESGLGLRGYILVDELLVLLPFLAMQWAGWAGLFPAERALRDEAPERGYLVDLLHDLAIKSRQAMGLILPVALLFLTGQDLLRTFWPRAAANEWVQLGEMAVLGALVLLGAPALVRMAWPTRSLPPGPLRDRLDRLARRFGFRCTDILVWDTGGTLVNAGVTGVLPWFRYVLLTDALVERLEERQIEAVFGHEIGHVAHRHFFYFGFFFLGSLAVISLLLGAVDRSLSGGAVWAWLARYADGPDVGRALELLACAGAYFLPTFGFLSRRFEQQADVFGCRVVSCGRADCPPHGDVNGHPGELSTPRTLCQFGIHTFILALSRVAELNGIEPGSRSWRHGSIVRRVRFLQDLEGHPEAERRFQAKVRWLRMGVAVGLIVATAVAAGTGSLSYLGP